MLRRTAYALVICLSFAAILWASSRTTFVISGHSSGGYTGTTLLGSGSGCGGCHASDSSMTVVIDGPTTLRQGQSGTYTVTATRTSATAGQRVGLNVASSDSGSLVVNDSATQLVGNELTHQTPKMHVSGTASYTFVYTMPMSAAVGSTHTLAATAAVGYGGGWKHASSLMVTATAPSTTPTSYYVNVASGSDTNNGANSTPFKTIKRALQAAVSGDTVNVAGGTYRLGTGETFPIVLPPGVKLRGSGASATIIDAAGSNERVVHLDAGTAGTELSGFTITGGRYTNTGAGSPTRGGGIYAENGDQTLVTRNIIKDNEARGYEAFHPNTSGGPAYGGGIMVSGASTVITNNLIIGNRAIGGQGQNNNGSTTPGGNGGGGYGGGVHAAFGTPVLFNNTIAGNSAIGGRGGSSLATAGNGGNGEGGGAFGGTHVNTIFSSNSAVAGDGANGAPSGMNGNALVGGLHSGDANHCLFFSNGPMTGETIGTNAVLANPQFVDEANGNYRVGTSSPAVGAGTSTGAPSIDLEGSPRPSPPTIGAYEAGKFSTTTTVTSSPNPSQFESLITFTASVSSPSPGTISGMVTIRRNGDPICTAPITNGIASCGSTNDSPGTYSITASYAGDANFASSTSSVHSHTVVLPPFGPPPNAIAGRTGTSGQVLFDWTPVQSAVSYEVQRGTTLATLSTVASVANDYFVDDGLALDTTYLYRVRAVRTGESSAFAPIDLVTLTYFEDEPLNSAYLIRAEHVTSLRRGVNAVRAAGGLSPYPFTDAIVPGVPVRAVHISQLRTALNEGRAAIGVQTLSFTDPTITPGVTRVKSEHLQELRSGVQ